MSLHPGIDEQLPANGWDIKLSRNLMLCEQVGQLPQSSRIITPQQSKASNTAEWHMIVHDLPEMIDPAYEKLNIEPGDRIVISGSATCCFVNRMQFWLVGFNTVQAVLHRRDGQKWLGTKFGERAVADGCPAEPQEETGAVKL